MKISLLVIGITSLFLGSCAKDTYNKSMIATSDRNGVGWKTAVSIGGTDSSYTFALSQIDEVSGASKEVFIITNIRKTKDKQYAYLYKNDLPFRCSMSLNIGENDEIFANYKLLESDTVNNYFQYTNEKADFTEDIEATFSATLVHDKDGSNSTKPNTNYSDTIRIRNGKMSIKSLNR